MSKDRCQLAVAYDEVKHDVRGWLWSEKYDGVRATWDGMFLRTRNGMNLHPPRDLVVSFLKQRTRLDMELWLGRGRFEETMSVLHRTTDWPGVYAMVFDVPTSKQLTYLERTAHLTSDERVVVAPQHKLTHCPYDLLRSTDLASDAEGVMLRNPDAVYHFGRNASLLKVKRWCLDHVTVVGYNRDSAGRIYSIRGHDTDVASGFPRLDLERADRIFPPGTVLKVRRMADGRHPSFEGVVE